MKFTVSLLSLIIVGSLFAGGCIYLGAYIKQSESANADRRAMTALCSTIINGVVSRGRLVLIIPENESSQESGGDSDAE